MKQRSWDSRQHPTGSNDAQYATRCSDSHNGKPVRIVEWQKDWPPQEDIPHAGTKWIFAGKEVIIQSGIPSKSGSSWGVDFAREDGRGGWATMGSLLPLPPKPERVEGEVMGQIRLHGGEASDISHIPAGEYYLVRKP